MLVFRQMVVSVLFNHTITVLSNSFSAPVQFTSDHEEMIVLIAWDDVSFGVWVTLAAVIHSYTRMHRINEHHPTAAQTRI